VNIREEDVLTWMFQVFNGLRYLHVVVKITHNDMKPGNMLVSPEGNVALSDFSLSDSPDKLVHGMAEYMSPERLEGRPSPGSANDVFGAGLSMMVVVNRGFLATHLEGLPRAQTEEEHVRQRGLVLERLKEQAGRSWPPPFSQWARFIPSQKLLEVLRGCLSLDPALRWSVDQVLEYLKDVRPVVDPERLHCPHFYYKGFQESQARVALLEGQLKTLQEENDVLYRQLEVCTRKGKALHLIDLNNMD